MDADTTLAVRLARDLDRTFDTLVVAHQDRLYTIALRMLGDPEEAREVAQDALVRAYRALSGYPPERTRDLALRPWLASIALNLARNRRRRAGARPESVGLATVVERGSEPADRPSDRPDAHRERRESTEAWARRLAALPASCRAAVILRHVDGLAYREVAAALDRPEGTVKAQVHRGLRLLRAALAAEAAAAPETRREMSA